MSSSQDGTTSPKSLFGWYKEHITGAIASFAARATMAGCVVPKEKIRLDDWSWKSEKRKIHVLDKWEPWYMEEPWTLPENYTPIQRYKQ